MTELTSLADDLINSNEFKELISRRKNNTYNLITSNVIKKGGVISEDKPLRERIIESNKRIVALINELNKEKEMKHKFQNAKIVVGEYYNEIVKILKDLGYDIESFNTGSPFIIFNKKGEAFGCTNNHNFYSYEHPLITLDTLKQWQRENVELVEKDFYYCENEEEKFIFQFKRIYEEIIYDEYSYLSSFRTLYNNDRALVNINRCKILRPATEEEIQLLKDKVKEQTGKVFNEETKMFEEVKKEVIFKPFDKVLVRDGENEEWEVDIYRKKENNVEGYNHVCFYDCWKICIPYEGNEHLL